MSESLIQLCRVCEEGLRVVKHFQQSKKKEYFNKIFFLTIFVKEAPANFVPAAAVIRGVQALIKITGRKGCVGCF